MKTFDQELVSGGILRSVWKLSLPIVLMNLINGVHGIVDQMLIGRYVEGSKAAMSAIGISWNVFLVVVVTLAAMFYGMSVLIAQYAGAQDREHVNRVFFCTSLMTVGVVVVVVAPVGWFLSPWLLSLVNAKPDQIENALPYLRLLFTGGVTLSINFMMNMALQSAGDARTPLFLIVLTTLLNVGVSAALISGAGPFEPMGTTGAALGTVLGPIPSIVIVIALVLSGKSVIGLPKKLQWGEALEILGKAARIGIPTGIQAVFLNIGGIVLFRFINQLEVGVAAAAAYTVCYAQIFSLVTWTSMGLRNAASTLMGQNIGADKPHRAKRAVHLASLLGAAWAAGAGLLFWFTPGAILGLFKVDPDVLEIGSDLLRYLGVSGVFLAMALTLTGGLIGAGHTKKPMYIAFIAQIAVLLGLCWFFQVLGMLSTHTIWLSILVCHVTRFALTAGAFEFGDYTVKMIETRKAT